MTVDNNTINQPISQPGPAENTCLWRACGVLVASSPSVKRKVVEAASFWTFLCKRSYSMPAASLSKVDPTSQS